LAAKYLTGDHYPQYIKNSKYKPRNGLKGKSSKEEIQITNKYMGKKVLKAFNHQGNVNKNYSAIQYHVKKTKLTNTGEEIRKRKLYTLLVEM
jgi:hypothetical protein